MLPKWLRFAVPEMHGIANVNSQLAEQSDDNDREGSADVAACVLIFPKCQAFQGFDKFIVGAVRFRGLVNLHNIYDTARSIVFTRCVVEIRECRGTFTT